MLLPCCLHVAAAAGDEFNATARHEA